MDSQRQSSQTSVTGSPVRGSSNGPMSVTSHVSVRSGSQRGSVRSASIASCADDEEEDDIDLESGESGSEDFSEEEESNEGEDAGKSGPSVGAIVAASIGGVVALSGLFMLFKKYHGGNGEVQQPGGGSGSSADPTPEHEAARLTVKEVMAAVISNAEAEREQARESDVSLPRFPHIDLIKEKENNFGKRKRQHDESEELNDEDDDDLEVIVPEAQDAPAEETGVGSADVLKTCDYETDTEDDDMNDPEVVAQRLRLEKRPVRIAPTEDPVATVKNNLRRSCAGKRFRNLAELLDEFKKAAETVEREGTWAWSEIRFDELVDLLDLKTLKVRMDRDTEKSVSDIFRGRENTRTVNHVLKLRAGYRGALA